MATIYKRGKTYWVKWYESGTPKYESLKTTDRKKALTAKAAKELALHTGQKPAADANCTLEEFTERYLAWRDSEHSANAQVANMVRRSFMKDLGSYRLLDLDAQVVETWKRSRAEEVGPSTGKTLARSTVNCELSQLKAVTRKAVEWGVIPRDPLVGVKKFRGVTSAPKRFFSPAELERLYAADPGTAPMWKLLANTGMRLGEACHLRWEHVTERSVRVVSNADHPTKSRKWREVPLSPGGHEALDELGGGGSYVFPTRSVRVCQRWFRRAADVAGVDGTPHELRHTFISHLVMQGVPIRTVQALAGHSSVAVTEQYSHLAPEHMASAVAGLSL